MENLLFLGVPILKHIRVSIISDSDREGKRIIPEMWFASFPVLSVDPRVGISRSASDAD